jgi:MarR family transcriptional regulator, organic hydroperoxide resistance regulator
MSEAGPQEDERLLMERAISADLRELTSESDWIARAFAGRNNVSANEFRALLFVMIAEGAGVRMTAGDLRKNMGLSGAAITYLVERMAENGHLRREVDPTDRRKVILRYGDHGKNVAREFFARLREHTHAALADLPDEDLRAAHRTFGALVAGMRAYRAEMPTMVGPDIVTHD